MKIMKQNYYTTIVVSLELFKQMNFIVGVTSRLTARVDDIEYENVSARVYKIELLDDGKIEVFFDNIEYEK